jgi:hypothetical protein
MTGSAKYVPKRMSLENVSLELNDR